MKMYFLLHLVSGGREEDGSEIIKEKGELIQGEIWPWSVEQHNIGCKWCIALEMAIWQGWVSVFKRRLSETILTMRSIYLKQLLNAYYNEHTNLEREEVGQNLFLLFFVKKNPLLTVSKSQWVENLKGKLFQNQVGLCLGMKTKEQICIFEVWVVLYWSVSERNSFQKEIHPCLRLMHLVRSQNLNWVVLK